MSFEYGLPATTYPDARVLVIDDEEANVRLVAATLHQAGYRHVDGLTDARKAAAHFRAWRPDLVLLDVRMPHRSGVDVLHELQTELCGSACVPVVMLTADGTHDVKTQALAAGATDFLTKPFSPVELLLRIHNHLRTRFLYLELERQKLLLEERVRQRTQELEEAQLEILERLALAAEFRDDATGEHARRVGQLSALIARELGLSTDESELIRRAALLHDLGKIGIPDSILLKPGRYSPDEFRHMQSHTEIGSRIVAGSHSPLLRLVEKVTRTHHEHWDGSGYSPGMEGEAIPLSGRIVAVADVYDALTQARPYKPAWSVEEAGAEIRRQRGRQFDPAVVDAFLRVLEEPGPGETPPAEPPPAEPPPAEPPPAERSSAGLQRQAAG